jgi:mucin-19
LSLGDASATKNTDSIGAAVSLNIATVTNTATISLGDTINAAGVSVTALMPNANQANDFSTQALGAAIGIQAGVAGSAGINVITIATEASIVGSYSTTDLNGGDTATIVNSSGGLTVQAVNNETLQNIAFTVAVGSTAGVGAAIDVNVIGNATKAHIGANIEANVSDAIQVTANSSLTP